MSKTVFVGNLSWGTTADSLTAIMETAGRVLGVEVQAHSDTGRSKGWALVTFETAEDASRAMELLCGREVEGRPLYVREDRTEIEKEEGFVVFVGNLPWDMTASGLRTVFSEFSPYDVHIKTNMSGRSRGFGLLRFRSSEEAQRAIEQMHGITVQERKILVRLDRAHLEMMGHSPATMEASDTVTCGNIPWHTGDEVLACGEGGLVSDPTARGYPAEQGLGDHPLRHS
ncbi:hypothetical protein NGA_0682100 [Nannochloropsis gaditana CCMP526]|uniref:uncharacterized protein n=1 Tax=Nannochloropsis gaditana (strain CCMP526) TaxID=1093141 RepID=UPI00029F55DB|nr:hypothetical protein NGA_0682100 [Nannochloropsis gaditana CCMP526]EKU23049.1 hypothetical protein NGA_0682100 [Nannochloropsis gaditana CCMP526]|eukprot:XP_005852780.1 hypothetical protein NGA_0682100 [Nannochloropsis gaditana CCMP526]